jgi:hypothetical protein
VSAGLRPVRRGLSIVHAVCVAMLLSGCSALHVGALDKAMFPAIAQVAARAPEAVTISLAPPDAALEITGPSMGDPAGTRVRLPIGAILEAAALAAFDSEFAGGVQLRQGGTGAPVQSPAAVTSLWLTATNIRFDYRNDFVYFIPLGPLTMERWDLTLRLSVDVRVLGERGVVLWSRSYDTGRELWQRPPRTWTPERMFRIEDDGHRVQRFAHEQAARLMQQAARDVRQWNDHEQHRERIL